MGVGGSSWFDMVVVVVVGFDFGGASPRVAAVWSVVLSGSSWWC